MHCISSWSLSLSSYYTTFAAARVKKRKGKVSPSSQFECFSCKRHSSGRVEGITVAY
jgi:hypothetical protein